MYYNEMRCIEHSMALRYGYIKPGPEMQCIYDPQPLFENRQGLKWLELYDQF